MSLLRNIAAGLRSLFRREQVDRELDEELGSYLEMEAAEKMRQGVSHKDALREVRLERGSLEVTKELVRSGGWESFVETCWQDLRFAIRMLRKNLGFTSVAVLVMALGIGANAAMFSVVNAVLLKPLAFSDPDRIVTLSSLWKRSGGHGQVSAPDLRDWRDQSTAFASLAYYGYTSEGQTSVVVGSSAEYANVAMVSSGFFQVFHVEPSIGREFSLEEQTKGGAAAVIVSNAFGIAHFGGTERALGQTLRMFGKTLNVVGVMPSGFRFPDKTDIWFPTNTI